LKKKDTALTEALGSENFDLNVADVGALAIFHLLRIQ
jgi:hypothetical protein